MPISSVHNDQHKAGELQEKAGVAGAQKADAPPAGESKAPGLDSFEDRYDKSDDEAKGPLGLYQLTKDEDGNPQILVDGAKPKRSAAGNAPEDKPADAPGKPAEDKDAGKPTTCTVNTDRVDSEIKNLKQQQRKLQQEIRMSADNADKSEELKARLIQIENELRMKDNDAYRRQNSAYTFG